MTTTLIFDTECTDANEPELIEAGGYFYEYPDDRIDFDVASVFHIDQRYKPTKPIAFGAMGVHHILESDLLECPPSSSFELPMGVDYLIGHNIDFDWRVIGEPDIKRIDTLAMARWLFPNASSHQLSALMYQMNPPSAHQAIRSHLRNAHSALADCQSVAVILGLLIAEARQHCILNTWAELWEFSEHCRVPTHWSFGKHKGTPISQTPPDYIAWMLKQPDVDPYLRKALEQA